MGGVFTVIALLGIATYHYRNEVRYLEGRLEVAVERNRELTARLRSLGQECSRTIESLQEGCSEKLRIEKEEHKRQLRACRKLLERRSKLERKLDEIDSLP